MCVFLATCEVGGTHFEGWMSIRFCFWFILIVEDAELVVELFSILWIGLIFVCLGIMDFWV